MRIHWEHGGEKFTGQGDAMALRGDTLYFSSLSSGLQSRSHREYVRHIHGVYIPDLDRIELLEGRKGNGMRGTLAGAAIGAALGAFVYATSQGDVFEAPPETIPLGAALCAVIGAGIGAVVRTTRAREVTPDELRRMLESPPPSRSMVVP